MKRTTKLAGIAAVTTGLLSGCANPPVLKTADASDEVLTCPELQEQYNVAQRVGLEASREKGIDRNAIRAVFWPLIVGSVVNANKSIGAAEARKQHLASLMTASRCPIPDGPDLTPGAKAQLIFKGTVTAVRDLASSQIMMPVRMPNGTSILIPSGAPASQLLTIKGTDGSARTVHTFQKYALDDCLGLVAEPEIPRGLRLFGPADVKILPETGCIG